MAKMRAISAILIIFLSVIAARADKVTTRVYETNNPPKVGEYNEEGARKIVRVYKKQTDANESGAAQSGSEMKFFVGAGLELFSKNRHIEVDTFKNGERVKCDEVVIANGETYSCKDRESENGANVEFGASKGELVYIGAKGAFYKEFVEAGLFLGAKLTDKQVVSFAPFVDIMVGAGYKTGAKTGGKDNVIKPDNYSIGLALGLSRTFADGFEVYAKGFYRHRVWQEIEKIYGRERWICGEAGAGIGARYYF
ncbi:MAG: hypothetical protein LBU73_00810 [Helicobacteraceae bacterium]|nr:hypothetical protein [Helicobacteraceae bacterium]